MSFSTSRCRASRTRANDALWSGRGLTDAASFGTLPIDCSNWRHLAVLVHVASAAASHAPSLVSAMQRWNSCVGVPVWAFLCGRSCVSTGLHRGSLRTMARAARRRATLPPGVASRRRNRGRYGHLDLLPMAFAHPDQDTWHRHFMCGTLLCAGPGRALLRHRDVVVSWPSGPQLFGRLP